MFGVLLERRFFTPAFARRNRTKRGATAVEMALIAPVFFMMFIGLTEVSLIMLTQNLMENATYNATRLAKTGYTADGKTQEQTVLSLLTNELASLGSLVDVQKITMSHAAYASLSNVGQPGQAVNNMGAAQQIVVYTVTYPWKVFTPMFGQLLGDAQGNLNLTSRIVVRNEPYS